MSNDKKYSLDFSEMNDDINEVKLNENILTKPEEGSPSSIRVLLNKGKNIPYEKFSEYVLGVVKDTVLKMKTKDVPDNGIIFSNRLRPFSPLPNPNEPKRYGSHATISSIGYEISKDIPNSVLSRASTVIPKAGCNDTRKQIGMFNKFIELEYKYTHTKDTRVRKKVYRRLYIMANENKYIRSLLFATHPLEFIKNDVGEFNNTDHIPNKVFKYMLNLYTYNYGSMVKPIPENIIRGRDIKG